MTLEAQISDYIREWYIKADEAERQKGLTASEISEGAGIWQNSAVTVLKQLCDKGVLASYGKKPVHYLPADSAKGRTVIEPAAEEPLPLFARIIGADGSLSAQIQLVKAGASYPPNGMHMLIVGESGVGKTLLAEETWRYFNSIHGASKSVPFIVFNCAEYAENPQLLLSQLFGYEKGAYTGADTSHKGLVEIADGGILFLDEIHRLSKTGQEMLFTLLDKGLYRRMGSIEDRHAALMMIGATTEAPNTSFLKTFLRRIPMIIEIPPLRDRPVRERIDLVFHFAKEEAKRMGIPVKITPEVLKLLISYNSDANIGDLKNEIEISCARSYLSITNGKHAPTGTAVVLSGSSLSRQLQEINVDDKTDKYISDYAQTHNMTAMPDNTSSDVNNSTPSFYDFVENRIAHYSSENISTADMGRYISMDILSSFQNNDQHSSAENEHEQNINIFSSVTPEIMNLAHSLMKQASLEFKWVYSDNIVNTLALFLQHIRFQANVNQASSMPLSKKINNIEKEVAFVQHVQPQIQNAMDINLTSNEINIIALLLSSSRTQQSRKRPGLIIMGHGDSTATSIADFTNHVLDVHLAYAVDVPISMNAETAVSSLCETARCVDHGKGVIILTDTGNFEFYQQKVKEITGISCRVIPDISTTMSLEICKSILTSDEDIQCIANKCIASYQDYTKFTLQRALSESNLPSTSPVVNVILICCITGAGSARRLREYLLQYSVIYINTEIIPLGLQDNIDEIAKKYGSRLKLIIGFINPEIKGVPFISMEQVANQEGINRIVLILKGWAVNDLPDNYNKDSVPLHQRFKQISERINYFAPSIDSTKAAKMANYVVTSVENISAENIPDDLKVRMYIHVVTMFERLKSEGPLAIPDDADQTIQKCPKFYHLLKGIMENACRSVDVKLQDSEIYYFMLSLPESIRLESEGNIHESHSNLD